MRIEADNEKLQYCGRINWSNPKAPIFVYPCTSVRMRFTGSILKIYIRNKNVYWNNFLGCILDGKQMTLALPRNGAALLEIPVEKEDLEEHEVLFFKRQDSCHEFAILGLEIAEGGN
ncbi:MAG: electron transporter RnfD, partial [Bariatricus sp.]